MLKIGDRLICVPRNTKIETSHCIRATVVDVNKKQGTVSVVRALGFGTLPMKKILTLQKKELLEYYTLVVTNDNGHDYEKSDATYPVAP